MAIIIIRQKAITVEMEAPTQVPIVSVAALHSINMSTSTGVNSNDE